MTTLFVGGALLLWLHGLGRRHRRDDAGRWGLSDGSVDSTTQSQQHVWLPNHQNLYDCYGRLPSGIRTHCPDYLAARQWWVDNGTVIDIAVALLLALLIWIAVLRMREIGCWAIKSNQILRRLDALETKLAPVRMNL